MKAFIQKRIRQVESWLKELPIGELGGDCFRDECLSVAREIKAEAIRTGHPAIVELCQRRNGGLRYTQRLLAECLATFTAETLSPPEVAKQLAVKPATVVGWIKSGQLKAANLSKGVRPRYRVQPEDLKSFLDKRQPQQRAKSTPRTRKVSRF